MSNSSHHQSCDEVAAELRRRIEPLLARFDLGGLADASRRPWYPVLAADLRDGRNRIGASEDEVEALLNQAGFTTDER